MTKKLVLAAVLMLSIVMVSCTTKPTDTTNSNSTTVDQGTQSKDSSNKEAEKPKEEPKENKIKLSIYSIDENSLEPNESGTIEVNENASVEDKLKALAKELSEKKFDKLSIEVKSIDKVDGKKVATINLADSDGKKWVAKFQGSTGGAITANTLIENFLQSNNKNKGEWIDGVKFLYNNKPIEYEHVADLATTHYIN